MNLQIPTLFRKHLVVCNNPKQGNIYWIGKKEKCFSTILILTRKVSWLGLIKFPEIFHSREREFPKIFVSFPGIPGNSRNYYINIRKHPILGENAFLWRITMIFNLDIVFFNNKVWFKGKRKILKSQWKLGETSEFSLFST